MSGNPGVKIYVGLDEMWTWTQKKRELRLHERDGTSGLWKDVLTVILEIDIRLFRLIF